MLYRPFVAFRQFIHGPAQPEHGLNGLESSVMASHFALSRAAKIFAGGSPVTAVALAALIRYFCRSQSFTFDQHYCHEYRTTYFWVSVALRKFDLHTPAPHMGQVTVLPAL
jgi:hypothetical protein